MPRIVSRLPHHVKRQVRRVRGKTKDKGLYARCQIVLLFDRRADNGTVKLDEAFLGQLYELVDGSPREHGFPRPTWTRELLCRVMFRRTGWQVHPGTTP